MGMLFRSIWFAIGIAVVVRYVFDGFLWARARLALLIRRRSTLYGVLWHSSGRRS